MLTEEFYLRAKAAYDNWQTKKAEVQGLHDLLKSMMHHQLPGVDWVISRPFQPSDAYTSSIASFDVPIKFADLSDALLLLIEKKLPEVAKAQAEFEATQPDQQETERPAYRYRIIKGQSELSGDETPEHAANREQFKREAELAANAEIHSQPRVG